MVSIKDLTDYLSAHKLLNFKIVESKPEHEIHRTDCSGPCSNSTNSSFPDPTDIYSTSFGTYSSFPTTTTIAIDDGNKSERKLRTTALELLCRFGQTTSMHGLSQAMGDRPRWRRLVWATLVIGFSIWATYNVTNIISDFRKNPVITSVSSEYQGKVKFPAVTICNLNKFRLSKVPKLVKDLTAYYMRVGAS